MGWKKSILLKLTGDCYRLAWFIDYFRIALIIVGCEGPYSQRFWLEYLSDHMWNYNGLREKDLQP